MILANTSFFLSPVREESFLVWVRSCYIPALTNAGFTMPRLLRILGGNDPSVVSYALQVEAPDETVARNWLVEGEGERLRGDFATGFREECLWFITLMKPV